MPEISIKPKSVDVEIVRPYDPEARREASWAFWRQWREGALLQIDAIERRFQIEPRTADLRKRERARARAEERAARRGR